MAMAASLGSSVLDPIAAPARPGGRVGTPQQLTRWRLDTTRAPDWALCDAGYIGAIAQTAPAQAPLVGRDDELDLLLDTVGRVATAGLTAVVVSGEAGIGKSRLLAEARARLAGRGWPRRARPPWRCWTASTTWSASTSVPCRRPTWPRSWRRCWAPRPTTTWPSTCTGARTATRSSPARSRARWPSPGWSPSTPDGRT